MEVEGDYVRRWVQDWATGIVSGEAGERSLEKSGTRKPINDVNTKLKGTNCAVKVLKLKPFTSRGPRSVAAGVSHQLVFGLLF